MGFQYSFLHLLRVKQPCPPATTVAALDEEENLQPAEHQLQNVALSHANETVLYSQMSWLDAGSATP